MDETDVGFLGLEEVVLDSAEDLSFADTFHWSQHHLPGGIP